MPEVLIAPTKGFIAVNGTALDVSDRDIQYPPNLYTATWQGTPEDGYGVMQFTDDYDQKLAGVELYNEEIKPYVDIFEQWQAEIEEGKEQAKIEAEKRLYGLEARFAELRRQRDEKLTQYDAAISQLERERRSVEAAQVALASEEEIGDEEMAQMESKYQGELASIAELMAEWDAYAKKLCKLPDQEGAPWDFRIEEGPGAIPWPTPPSAAKTATE